MRVIASQITSLTIVYSTVYSGADERKHQSSLPLALVRVIHWSLVNSPHKGPVTRKMFPFDDVIMWHWGNHMVASVAIIWWLPQWQRSTAKGCNWVDHTRPLRADDITQQTEAQQNSVYDFWDVLQSPSNKVPFYRTQWGPCWSTWVQVVACCLIVMSHYLDQCWLTINAAQWYSPEEDFTGNAQAASSWDVCENCTFEILANVVQVPWHHMTSTDLYRLKLLYIFINVNTV